MFSNGVVSVSDYPKITLAQLKHVVSKADMEKNFFTTDNPDEHGSMQNSVRWFLSVFIREIRGQFVIVGIGGKAGEPPRHGDKEKPAEEQERNWALGLCGCARCEVA